DGFTVHPDRGLDEATATWRAEITRGRELTADASLDDSGNLSGPEAGHVGDQGVSLRWIMIHMIEEYARHNGHADLIREHVDGVTVHPDRGLDEATATWRAEITRGRELTADASLDDSGNLSGPEAGHVGDQGVSLRWIMIHMIEEYARHNGHADLIREQVDGV